MPTRTLRFRFVWPIVLISTGLISLGAIMATFLLGQQARIADVLGENIDSRRAAADLEESLLDLIALLNDRVEGVSSLHERIEKHLANIKHLADHDEEQRLANRLILSYQHYRNRWATLPAPTAPGHEQAVREAVAMFETETLRRCQELRDYNDHRIEVGAEDHRRVLRELAWGIAAVGVAGGLAGLLLGYLMARGLERSIRRLQVHVKDAAGILGRDTPDIVLTGEGDLEGLQGQMQDLVRRIEEVVARLQQREREIRRAEHLAAVGQLAAGVAHEMRNPLTSIKMLVQAGSEDSSGLPPDDLDVIEREIRRMEKSLDGFLKFTRPARPERRQHDLVKVIHQTLELIGGRADRQRITVRFDGPETLPALVDGEQLHQVLINLCLNALDAMPCGGVLSLALRSDGRITVTDTGRGIAPEILPRLFEPFVSGKETGLGLGLVISRRIVEDHGGSLTATNLAAGGACFIVRLSLKDEG